MTDLTKLTAPLGLLDEVYGPGTQEALKSWPHGWEVYVFSPPVWHECPNPFWSRTSTYRAKPAPLTKPSADWSLLPKWAKFIVRDANGDMHCHDVKPVIASRFWLQGECARFARRIDDFPFVTPGTCHWRDSLVERPENLDRDTDR